MKSMKRKKGFTLAELLIVVAIIYLVMVLIFSKLVTMLERRLRNSDH